MVTQIATIPLQENRSNVIGTDGQVRRVEPNVHSYWYMLHLLTILGATAISLIPQSLIPRHNSIYYPDSWYEIWVVGALFGTFVGRMRSMLEFFIFTKENSIVTINAGLKIFAWSFVPNVCIIFLTQYYWTSLMGLQYPMPLMGLFVFFTGWLSFICTMRFGVIYPSNLWKNLVFRKTIKTYVMFEAWILVMAFQSDVLAFGFKAITGSPQCLFALMIPLARAMNKKILMKFVAKMVGNNDEMANVFHEARVNIIYALFVAIRMNGAENLTVVSIILVDILLQSKLAIDIIKMKRQVSTDGSVRDAMSTRLEKQILKLLMAELTEGLVPISYAIGFAMLYYGPNAHLTGNVLSDLWQYEKVEDVTRLFFIQGILFGVDLLCVTMNAYLVANFGNVDLMKQLCKLLKNYWMVFAILMMDNIFFYFAFHDINLGVDMTLTFEWITAEGRMKFINDSTEIMKDEKESLLSCFN